MNWRLGLLTGVEMSSVKVILGDMLRGRSEESSFLFGETEGARSTILGAGKQVDEDDGEIWSLRGLRSCDC